MLYNPRTNSRDPSHEIFVFLFTILLSESGVDQRHYRYLTVVDNRSCTEGICCISLLV